MRKTRPSRTDKKIAVLVPDGAADLSLDELGGRTPLEVARTPAMDRIALSGRTGTARTIPKGMTPGSDVANLSLLGYDPSANHPGRGPLEAASMGLEIEEGFTVFRCNLVSTEGDLLSDYSAGHIESDEARHLIEELDRRLGGEGIRFFPGKSYRHILMMKGDYLEVECFPPHDIMGRPLADYLPRGRGSERLIELMEASRPVLMEHPVNRERVSRGEPMADIIWPWGQGIRPNLPSIKERFNITGGIISAVDLVNGIGRSAGLEVYTVPGATGYLDTDYQGKGETALEVLSNHQFVYVHVEAPDEASHMADPREKIKAIERFDTHVVAPVLDFLEGKKGGRVLVAPDHYTLISTRTHDPTPVPFALCGSGIPPDGSRCLSEAESRASGKHFEQGWRLFYYLMEAEGFGR